MNEAQPLVGEQVTVVVKRGVNGLRAELHGRLLLAGHVGVLLANGQGLGLFPWHTIESVVATEPTTAIDEAQLVAAAAGWDQLQGRNRSA